MIDSPKKMLFPSLRRNFPGRLENNNTKKSTYFITERRKLLDFCYFTFVERCVAVTASLH